MSKIFFSCEHASPEIPDDFSGKLGVPEKTLKSHSGFDSGAREVCEYIVKETRSTGFYAEFSRLLIDVNRSFESRNLFSEYSRKLSYKEKNTIVEKYYDPFRNKVQKYTEGLIKKRQKVIHISVHSFTPVLKGQTRYTDIGLLYDPSRDGEKQFAHELRNELGKISPLQVKMNYPYLGISDGMVNSLRKSFKPDDYLGIEIELNQNLLKTKKEIADLCDPLSRALKSVLKKGLF